MDQAKTEVFRQVPRVFYLMNTPAVVVGVVFVLFAGAAFPALPWWWRMVVIPVVVLAATVLTLVNLGRPKLVVATDSVTVVAPWTSRRFRWSEVEGWFVAEQGGWCRVGVVGADGSVTVSPAPLGTRTAPGNDDSVPGNLADAAAAMDDALAAVGRVPLEPTPELRDAGRRGSYRLVWTTVLVPANLVAALIVVSFFIGR